MPRRIHVLPEKLANQIAAGEVVERPASVVKELVENALDAGASRVDVSIRNGGKTEIRVADDGHGMGREDALLAVDRHATSKVRNEADLKAIRTLGFRGEALPSIASVSRLVLETAERDGDGTRVVVTGGQVGAVDPCARRRGTTVSVRSLFFNVPARAKFLRSSAVESRAVSEVVTTLALAHPEVAFRLESGGRVLLDAPAAAGLAERIAAIWGPEEAAELIPVAGAENGAGVGGLVQRPHAARPGGRRVHLFVDGRPFADRAVVRAAERGYRTTVPEGVHPSLFLFLDLAPGAVDVNVHPAKAEVRFRDRGAVEGAVESAVRAALATLRSTPAIGARPASEAETAAPEPGAAPPEISYPTATALAAAVREPRRPLGGDDDEEQMALFVAGGGRRAGSDPAAEDDGGAVGERPRPLPETAGPAPAMWQVHNTYILAETRDGLILVDQHAAHERVLYEEIMHGFDAGPREGQRLLFPLTLRLSPAEYATVEETQGLLERIGFEVEPFGGRSVVVHAVPQPHPHFDAERALRQMIAELTEGSELVDAARTRHQRVALTYACKAAIKAGQRLSDREMTELFDRLFATELPFHDIHGRPTTVQLSLAELHRRFGRSG